MQINYYFKIENTMVAKRGFVNYVIAFIEEFLFLIKIFFAFICIFAQITK